MQIEYNAKGDLMVNMTELENRMMNIAEGLITDGEQSMLNGDQEVAEILVHKGDIVALIVGRLEQHRQAALAMLTPPAIDVPDDLSSLEEL